MTPVPPENLRGDEDIGDARVGSSAVSSTSACPSALGFTHWIAVGLCGVKEVDAVLASQGVAAVFGDAKRTVVGQTVALQLEGVDQNKTG